MRLREIEFGTSIGASGIEGFYGEGYWYHLIWKLLLGHRFSFKGMTFCAKTVLIPERPGNTPMWFGRWFITPIEPKPASIVVRFGTQVVLNAVGLSTEGAKRALERGWWQELTETFMLSFAFHSENEEEQLEEAREFVRLMLKHKPDFRAKFAIQWNDSCANTRKIGQISKSDFIKKVLDILGEIGVPILIKINTSFPIETAVEVESHPMLDGWVCSNAIAWDLISEFDLHRYFGTAISPLIKRWNRKLFIFFGRKLFTIPNAKGAVSGRIILPYVLDWIRRARAAGLRKPLIGGGGITEPADVDEYYRAGVQAISPGSMVMHTPWNLRKVIVRATEVFN